MQEVYYSFNSDTKLNIKFENTKPVNLSDFAVAMEELTHNFQDYTSREIKDSSLKSHLFLQEVRQGCFEFDLITSAPMILAVAHEYGILLEWIKYLAEIIENIKNKNNAIELHPKENKQIESIFKPVADDVNSQISFNIQNNKDSNISVLVISGQEAKDLLQSSNRYEDNEKTSDLTHKKQVFKWTQANFGENNKIGSKGVIESITKKPLKVIFDSPAIKEEMTTNNSIFDIEWQKLAYVVDAEVSMIDNKPVAYKIVKNYAEDTFDPSLKLYSLNLVVICKQEKEGF